MHIYIFSPIPYSFLHQRPQKLADQFLARSIPVTYIEPCGLTEYLAGRKKGLLQLVFVSAWYHCAGLFALLFPTPGVKHVARQSAGMSDPPVMKIISMPFVIPNNRVDSPLLERLNGSIYRQVLKRRIFRKMAESEISYAIVENPFWGFVLRKEDFTKIAYDCIDEISLFSGKGSAGRFERYERDLLDISSAVFVTAEKLQDRLRPLVSTIPLVRVPNGVDYDFFQKRAAEGTLPDDLRDLNTPIVGYVGVLRDWFDYDLTGFLAAQMPDVTFVFVGPLDFDSRIAHFKGFPNMKWLGRKEYREMPVYINRFDVCLIPFLVGKISRTTNPVKVFEYFALGKPVVSTPLYELEPFEKDHLLWISGSKELFAAAVRTALEGSSAADGERRRAVARNHSWKSLAETMVMTPGLFAGAQAR